MAYASFFYEVKDGIGTIRLNDPDRLNALTFETYADLEHLTEDVAYDRSVQLLILTGAGKGFCSGGNVHEIIGRLIDMKRQELHQFTRMTCNVVRNMRGLKKPIIAAVNGIAAGAGAMLALASDFRLLSNRAKFSFLFVKVGLSGADMGACYLLPRLVGKGKATELLFLGDTIDAEESYRIGLAHRVLPHENLMEEAYTLARRLKESPLYAVGMTKELLEREGHMDLEHALALEARKQARCMETPDFKEGYRAFVDKRVPTFNRF